MKIAVIAKAEINNPKTYTVHKNKVTYHPENLFLSEEDKSVLEYAVQLVELKGGTIDVYTFEEGEVADRVLHEALALGADTATKIEAGDLNDPLQQNYLACKYMHFLKEQEKNYDLLLTGGTAISEATAVIAQKLGMTYYDHITMIDTSFNFEMKLEKGKITGKCKLPAVVSTLNAINVPRLADFVALSNALASNITSVSFKGQHKHMKSVVNVVNGKKEKIIFNLNDDPQATQKLVDALKQNGILR